MTRLFGLGIDFSVRDKMLWDKGGVHIILGFCPEDLIEEVQIKGRTCRQNESGSIQKIYYGPDLIKQGIIPKTETGEDPDDFKERKVNYPHLSLDDYLSAKRMVIKAKKLEEINLTLDENLKRHHESIKMTEAIKGWRTKEV